MRISRIKRCSKYTFAYAFCQLSRTLHAAFLIGMKKTVKQALGPMQISDVHAFLGRE